MRKSSPPLVILALLLFGLSPRAFAWSCNVSQNCSNGSTISCSGQSGTCTTGSNYVECGGTRTYCPWQSQACGLQYTCAYGGTLICSSQQGRCFTFPEFEAIGCDDKVMSCEECYPQFWCSF